MLATVIFILSYGFAVVIYISIVTPFVRLNTEVVPVDVPAVKTTEDKKPVKDDVQDTEKTLIEKKQE